MPIASAAAGPDAAPPRAAWSRSGALFCAGWALLPLVYWRGFGNTYSEPKLIALMSIALLCLASMAARAREGLPIRVSAFAIGATVLLLVRLATAGAAQNPGTFLGAVALDVCAIAIAVFVSNTELKAERLCGWLIPTLVLVLAGALSMILFREILVSRMSPFGSTIGWKNSLSVFLAQCVPLLLVLLVRELERAGRGERKGHAARVAGLLALLAVLFWVVTASRTRSAWGLLAFGMAAVALFALRFRDRILWRTLGGFAFAWIAGVILLQVVPNRLEWDSRTPYRDSLASMVSLTKTNGRVELWRVGLEMLASAPVRGVGTGNYPVVWRDSIADTDVDAKVFSFLRPDLPLFNDYLQDAIENGLPGGLLSLAVRLALPVFYLWQLFRRRDPSRRAEALLCIGCVAMSLDALVDYPFGRPETLLVFVVTLALVARGADEPGPARGRSIGRKAWLASAAAAALLLVTVSIAMLVGLAAKRSWQEDGSVEALRVALRFWPWDAQWKLEHWVAFSDADDGHAMERLAELRMRAWPSDPESHLIQATLLEKKGDLPGARERFRRALVTVEDGRCYLPAFVAYRARTDRPEYAEGAPSLEPELTLCARAVVEDFKRLRRREE